MPRPSRLAHAGARRVGAIAITAIAIAAIGGALAGVSSASMAGRGPTPTAGASPPAQATATPAQPSASATATASPTPTPTPQTVEFTLVAGGDVLPHTPVNRSATTADGYDYTTLMEPVRGIIEGADIALCHMEVPVAPEGRDPTGYPVFSAPAALVRDLGKVGWDGCSTASNHTVDKGEAGVAATLAAFEANDMAFAGSARTEDEPRTALYEVTQGDRTITLANISFAYGTNGMPVSAPWQVNLFNAETSDAQPIIDAATAARDAGADVVVASVHCCVEYRTAPTDAQRLLAQKIADSGAVDLYVGHHAHVPQPIELLAGGPSGTGMWTAFGLGNFISNQDERCCVAETSSGLLLTATIAVDPEGVVDVGVEWTGITVDRAGGHMVYPLTSGAVGTLSAGQVEARYERVGAAAGDQAAERAAE